ncbi:MAG TPA: hypothetical protein VF143_11145 [Candidatus Nanopelagicales bacterium]
MLTQLDQCRGRALGAADPSLISSYATPGSQVARADEALIAALIADGVTPRGWSTTLIALEEVVPERETGPSRELDPAAGSQGPDGSEPSDGLEASADPGPSAALGPSAHPDLEPGADEDRDVMVGPAVRQVRLVIVDRRSAYDLVDRAGRTVRAVPAAPEQRWAVTLQRGTEVADQGSPLGARTQAPAVASDAMDPGWRLAAVTREP